MYQIQHHTEYMKISSNNKELVGNVSKKIFSGYKKYVNELFIAKYDYKITEVISKYIDYIAGDQAMPRPLLTFFGYTHQNYINWSVQLQKITPIIYLPQLVRDLLAIHDDVVDEDKSKNGLITLPLSYSRLLSLNNQHEEITNFGKNISIFLGDALIGACFGVIGESLKIKKNVKLNIYSLTAELFLLTQKGQLNELVLQKTPINKISLVDIIDVHKHKASYYCYVFPLEIGLILSGCNEKIKNNAKDMMLKIGIASQLLDDIIGIFPERFNNQKDTLSDILLLRRTAPIVLLGSHPDISQNIFKILSGKKCTYEQASLIKSEMINLGVIIEIKRIIKKYLHQYLSAVNVIPFSSESKEYLTYLYDARFKKNLTVLDSIT